MMGEAAITQPMTLAYHEIMPQSSYAYCVPCASFDVHMCLLNSLARQGEPLRARVTFDDGEQSQALNALPLLKKHGISATYFINPALVGSEPKFLVWEQLRTLQAAGHSVQSHGWSHKFLTACDDQELALELVTSKQVLEDRLAAPVEEISVPGGRWDRRVVEACARAGYKRVYVSDPWIADEIDGVAVIGRFMVRRGTTPAQIEKVVRRDRRVLWTMRMRSQLKRRIVQLMGDGLYHRAWCSLTGYNAFEAARRARWLLRRSK